MNFLPDCLLHLNHCDILLYGLQFSSYSKATDPNVDGLIKIYEALRISISWLLTGEGKMYRSLPNDELEAKEQALINQYRMMSNDAQTAFNVSFKALSEVSYSNEI